MVDRPKTIEKPLVPMVSSKPFIQWQWWPWKPLMFHNGSNHSPKTPCLGRLNKLTIILIKYIKFVSSPTPNSTSPHFWEFLEFWTFSVTLLGNFTTDLKDCSKQLSILGRAEENAESARSVIYAIFSAHSAYFNVSRQKVPYFNVSRQKVPYFNVSRQKVSYFNVSRQKSVVFQRFATKSVIHILMCLTLLKHAKTVFNTVKACWNSV